MNYYLENVTAPPGVIPKIRNMSDFFLPHPSLSGPDQQVNFYFTLVNNSELLPSDYRVTIREGSNDNTINLIAEVKGPPKFKGGLTVSYSFNNTDSIMIKKDLFKNDSTNNDLFEDRFTSENTIYNDIDFGGTRDGYAQISFSDNVETFEIRHPICSNDKEHDICIKDDERIELDFILSLGNDSAYGDRTLYYSIGNGFFEYKFLPPKLSVATGIIPSANFILEVLERQTIEKRIEYFKGLSIEERNYFLKHPSSSGLIKFLNTLSENQLLEFLRSLKLKESDEMARLISTNDKNEIINRINDPNDKSEISKILTPSPSFDHYYGRESLLW